jgi:hypothetical protein
MKIDHYTTIRHSKTENTEQVIVNAIVKILSATMEPSAEYNGRQGTVSSAVLIDFILSHGIPGLACVLLT